MKKEITGFFKNLQASICHEFEKADGKSKFISDSWKRNGGGGGDSRVLQGGAVIEKGGVNFSEVHGTLSSKMVAALDLNESEFFATGVSIVIHPKSPMVPIIHMNVRYFEMQDGTRWFGGGIDLTPHYIDTADAKFFHKTLKETCDRHSPPYYKKFKKWADDYFYLQHREETRGVGGIFFDKLKEDSNFTIDQRWEFVKAVGETFTPVYLHLIDKNRNKDYTNREKQWQQIRRGRYVEFNLLYDKGTRFGLETDGRVESILMSLPAAAGWPYNFQPEPDSPEEKTLSFLEKGIDWIS